MGIYVHILSSRRYSMEYGYKDIVQLNDFSLYANNDKKQYELWFEEMIFYETQQDLINDFFGMRQLAKDIIGDYRIDRLEVFDSNIDTGFLDIAPIKTSKETLYYLHAVETFTGDNAYAVFQRFSDELDKLARIYL